MMCETDTLIYSNYTDMINVFMLHLFYYYLLSDTDKWKWPGKTNRKENIESTDQSFFR